MPSGLRFCSMFAPVLLAALAVCPRGFAADDGPGLEAFETHVRPTLIQHCIRCHGPKKQQGGLRLDSKQGWTVGGDSGPAVVVGSPDESLLVKAIRYDDSNLEMPPKGALPAATIDGFEQWIRSGAPDPRVVENDEPVGPNTQAARPPSVEQGKKFWAFQPIHAPVVPTVQNTDWPRADIDRFVLSQLEAKSIAPTSNANRTTLLRRLYFDLIGLPPTPQQIEEFLADRSSAAVEQVVDTLLDSPEFGQRWGRHWLDVVRYAESSGGGRTLLFPDAWRYRDYVIESFNRDLPYDQFLSEQIAGDLMPADDWQDRRRKLIATGFLLLGPTNYELQDKDVLEMDVVDEQLDTIGKGFLGMTMGCARCHDHKFDPIPTQDYYAMAGILKSTKAMIHSNVSQWNTRPLPESPEVERQRAVELAARVEQKQKLQKRLALLKAKLVDAGGQVASDTSADKKSTLISAITGTVVDNTSAERVGQWVESAHTAKYVGTGYLHDAGQDKGSKSVTFETALPMSGEYEVRLAYSPGPNRSMNTPTHVFHAAGETVARINQRLRPTIDGQFESLGRFQFNGTDGSPTVGKVVVSNEGTSDVVIADAVVFIQIQTAQAAKVADANTDDRVTRSQRIAKLQSDINDLNKRIKSIDDVKPVTTIAMAAADDDLVGDVHQAIRGVVHQPGPLTKRGVLQVANPDRFGEIAAGQSGRLELAGWIADARNPLTARVMANRIWYWMTDQGIVSTVDNFGSMGEPPSNPELLDYLASSFIADNWSVKSLIRKIALSRVYQMDTANDLRVGKGDAKHLDARSVDPDNMLMWRMNRKRLRAEDIRDAILFVSGSLDQKLQGSNIKPKTTTEYGYRFESTRRSVYVPVFRNTLPELFEVFDFADPNIQNGRRNASTVASQALIMMNHPFVITQSGLAADRLSKAADGFDDAGKIRYAFQQVLGRGPGTTELAISVDFIASSDPDDSTRWAMFYQTLFQSIDFRHLD